MGNVRKFNRTEKPARRDAIARWDADHRKRKHRVGNGIYPRPRRTFAPFALLRRTYGFAALMVLGLIAAWQGLEPQQEPKPHLISSITTSSYQHQPARVARERSPAVVGGNDRFPLCSHGRRQNCVVDGDTFWMNGEKIRISDINAPEVSNTRSADEARRGRDATLRLQRHLNSGRVELRSGARDTDRYGRSLRSVHVNGRSVGETMVREGHAQHWN